MSAHLIALVGRRGDTGKRYARAHAKAAYADGVAMALAGDMMQVWEALPNGDLLRYDGERTRHLSDKVVAARRAVQS